MMITLLKNTPRSLPAIARIQTDGSYSYMTGVSRTAGILTIGSTEYKYTVKYLN